MSGSIRPHGLAAYHSCMEVRVNGAARSIAHSCVTLRELVRELGLEGRRVAVEMNGEIVPKSRYGETRVSEGDTLEIVAAVAGG